MSKKQQNVDFSILPHAVRVLEPVYACTQRLQSDGCTIHHVYLEVKNVLAELRANDSPLRNEPHTLARLLSERFAYIYPRGTAFEPMYLVACST
jgi:hypothetical protein